MLRLALVEARKLGLSRVMLTCDDTNLASIKVIENCGGKLEKNHRDLAPKALEAPLLDRDFEGLARLRPCRRTTHFQQFAGSR